MKQTNRDPAVDPYNKVVKSTYYQILKYAKSMLSAIEHEELRFSLVRSNKEAITGSIIHEIVNPLLYLRLEQHTNGYYSIHYGFDTCPAFRQYYHIGASFARFIYKVTMASATPINIEDAIRVDFVILNCSEMYEHLEELQKHHHFELIKYKPAVNRRKQMKAVA
jgi:hypothetical protein